MAHNIYGIPQTINSANYAYFVALQALTKLNNPAIYQIFTGITQRNLNRFEEPFLTSFTELEEMLNLHRGQGLELFWRDSLACPTEEEYIAMVKNSMGSQYLCNLIF